MDGGLDSMKPFYDTVLSKRYEILIGTGGPKKKAFFSAPFQIKLLFDI